jgi:hypothetical protein
VFNPPACTDEQSRQKEQEIIMMEGRRRLQRYGWNGETALFAVEQQKECAWERPNALGNFSGDNLQ